MNRLTALVLLFSLWFIACREDENPLPDETDFRQEMRDFVQNISAYAKAINPDFFIIPQNGVELTGKASGNLIRPETAYLNAIDGVGQEDLFYGYDADDKETPETVQAFLKTYLDMAKETGVTILVTDYCFTHSKMDHSYTANSESGYISFAADHRDLDNIPGYPVPIYHENNMIINTLDSIRNFLYLINPDNEFATKQAFIQAIKNTNYDLLITDLFFDGIAFTAQEVTELKQKANGGKRLVISYMSIGEAENYRYYWQDDWKPGNPSFIQNENPDWQGNYVVRYWDSQWQHIIFGNDDSYLKKILDAGFDGAYLDIIDAYEYFEE